MTHLKVRRAVPEDAPLIRAVRERAIQVSAAGYYGADAIDAWASGGSEDDIRRMIGTTCAAVAVAGGAIAGWANLDAEEVDSSTSTLTGAVRASLATSLRSAPVFQRFGFTEVGRRARSYNGQTFHVVLMAKRLDAPPVTR